MLIPPWLTMSRTGAFPLRVSKLETAGGELRVCGSSAVVSVLAVRFATLCDGKPSPASDRFLTSA
jgi:hypothetical protein